MTTVTVLGAGYVGLTTAACLAYLGHQVHAIDIDIARVRRLASGHIDFLEPGLPEMIRYYQQAGQLTISNTAWRPLTSSEAVFICLPTPAQPDGRADMTAIDAAIPQLRDHLAPGGQVVLKSTVPPGTHRRLTAALARNDIAVVSNPEFLREGSAVQDWLHPDRVILGSDAPDHSRRVADLYHNITAPIVHTDPTSAELIKYAANTFLALKITYGNMLAELCEHLGANSTDVRTGLGHDPRIGYQYLQSGPGWGGPCLPKDTRALLAVGEQSSADLGLIKALIHANTHHQHRIVTLLDQLLPGPLAGARIGILGLAFKPGTSDVRDSPALPIISALAARQAKVTAYDPAVTNPVPGLTDHITHASDAAAALTGCDAALLVTEWPQFAHLPWRTLARAMRGNTVLDTRGHLDADEATRAGLRVHVLGKSSWPQPDLQLVRARGSKPA
ncbi:UDP-glucose dehydrogenase family protein [Sciscionella sediminilitoris]|uniref:UDP-glucose dehydrogenase family protein n=1 Tax=Sciscionella sediminilitoris TaxID=1445613 RepID=UPI0009EA1A73|nr:UDP-glucose/GDP-mannose dehydrogenase family protein [Sciscionella sp. SE31]